MNIQEKQLIDYAREEIKINNVRNKQLHELIEKIEKTISSKQKIH